MSHVISWIAAVGESDEVPDLLEQEATPALSEQADQADEWFELDRRRRVYRGRTVAMLRKYMRYSMETGRLPSLVGREFFRGKVTKYRVTTFEDRVIFVHDMESCLGRVTEFSRQVIARYFLQEHDLPSVARLLNCNEKTIRRAIPMALDELIEILLEAGLLQAEKSCQGGKTGSFAASDSKQDENKF